MGEITSVFIEALPNILEVLISLFIAAALAWLRPIRNRIAKVMTSASSKVVGYKALSEDDTIIHRRVQDIIVELRCRLGADRACIFQFENGSRFSLSNATWKITQTYETVSDGKMYYGKSIKREPISQMIDMVSPLFEPNRDYVGISNIPVIKDGVNKGFIFCVDEDRLHNCKFRYEMIKRGTRRAYLASLRDEEGKLFGVCKIAFTYKKELTEQELLTIAVASDKIQAHLNSMFVNSLKQ